MKRETTIGSNESRTETNLGRETVLRRWDRREKGSEGAVQRKVKRKIRHGGEWTGGGRETETRTSDRRETVKRWRKGV